jgi:hypothetical protein
LNDLLLHGFRHSNIDKIYCAPCSLFYPEKYKDGCYPAKRQSRFPIRSEPTSNAWYAHKNSDRHKDIMEGRMELGERKKKRRRKNVSNVT